MLYKHTKVIHLYFVYICLATKALPALSLLSKREHREGRERTRRGGNGISVGKVLGQLAIVLVYTKAVGQTTVLKTQYKTQFFKDTTHSQLYYTQKQLSSIILRGDIQRMLSLGPDLSPIGAANCLRRVPCWIWERCASRLRGTWCSRSSKSSNGSAWMPARSLLRCPLGFRGA